MEAWRRRGGGWSAWAVSKGGRGRGARQSVPQPLTEAEAGKACVKEALEKPLQTQYNGDPDALRKARLSTVLFSQPWLLLPN